MRRDIARYDFDSDIRLCGSCYGPDLTALIERWLHVFLFSGNAVSSDAKRFGAVTIRPVISEVISWNAPL